MEKLENLDNSMTPEEMEEFKAGLLPLLEKHKLAHIMMIFRKEQSTTREKLAYSNNPIDAIIVNALESLATREISRNKDKINDLIDRGAALLNNLKEERLEVKSMDEAAEKIVDYMKDTVVKVQEALDKLIDEAQHLGQRPDDPPEMEVEQDDPYLMQRKRGEA